MREKAFAYYLSAEMENAEETLKEAEERTFTLAGHKALVGLDGFVDKIVTPVNKRHGMGENFDPIETISDLGSRISAAAGKSANIELFSRFDKLGGNGPIMANSLLSLGLPTRYVGALGRSEPHPVFKDFAEKTEAITLADPGITTALEFKDGKVMFGDMKSLDDVDYSRILEVCGEGKFIDMLARANLVAIVNWTMIPKMTATLVEILEKIMPNLPPLDTRQFFFDLADPAKRSQEDILEALRVFARYQAHAEVTLGLNYNEAIQVSEVLGLNPQDEDSTGLRQMAQDIRNELELACVVVHPVSSAACATKEDSWWAPGPFTPNPKITTGAGDHFNAGFCAARLCGFSPRSCLTLASCTSGHYVRTAQSPSSSQVVGFLRELTQES